MHITPSGAPQSRGAIPQHALRNLHASATGLGCIRPGRRSDRGCWRQVAVAIGGKAKRRARAFAITPSASTTLHEQERGQFEGRGSWSVGDPVHSHTGSNVPCGKSSSGTAGAYIILPPILFRGGRWEFQQPLKRSESAQKPAQRAEIPNGSRLPRWEKFTMFFLPPSRPRGNGRQKVPRIK